MSLTRWFSLIFTGFGLMAIFQNCAPANLMFEDIQKSEEVAFFDYPHKTSPVFYGDVLLFQQESGVANLEDFKFIGTAAYLPNADASIAYSIKIIDPERPVNNNTLCPQRDDVLSPGQSTIEFDCSTTRSFSTMKIIMFLKSGTAETTIEKTYSK